MIRRERHHRRLRRPLLHMVPNLFTIASLCVGLTGLRYGLEGKFELAVMMIIASGILDGLDGRAARLLNVQSKLGAELDSLADCLNFGVAPALIVFFWSLGQYRGVGWAIALLFAVCCALRLARFNTELEDPNRPRWWLYFFKGIPAPAAGFLVLTPLMVSFAMGGSAWPRLWWVNAGLMVFVALMMVSTVPTFSVKRIRLRPDQTLPLLISAAIVVALLITEPWLVLSLLCGAYLLSIPASIAVARRMRLEEEASAAPATVEEEPAAPGDRVVTFEHRGRT